MRKIKKGLVCLAVGLLISASSVSSIVTYADEKVTVNETRADIIEWRYKTENSKLYRRKYNCSKQEWIGEWEFVANVV